jgi:hypothetical protein
LVDGLELAELLPYVDSKASGDRSSQCGGFAHGGAVDGDADNVGLCLISGSVMCLLVASTV